MKLVERQKRAREGGGRENLPKKKKKPRTMFVNKVKLAFHKIHVVKDFINFI
jgi:protein gp37